MLPRTNLLFTCYTNFLFTGLKFVILHLIQRLISLCFQISKGVSKEEKFPTTQQIIYLRSKRKITRANKKTLIL